MLRRPTACRRLRRWYCPAGSPSVRGYASGRRPARRSPSTSRIAVSPATIAGRTKSMRPRAAGIGMRSTTLRSAAIRRSRLLTVSCPCGFPASRSRSIWRPSALTRKRTSSRIAALPVPGDGIGVFARADFEAVLVDIDAVGRGDEFSADMNGKRLDGLGRQRTHRLARGENFEGAAPSQKPVFQADPPVARQPIGQTGAPGLYLDAQRARNPAPPCRSKFRWRYRHPRSCRRPRSAMARSATGPADGR